MFRFFFFFNLCLIMKQFEMNMKIINEKTLHINIKTPEKNQFNKMNYSHRSLV